FVFASRRRHTRSKRDWSSDVCSSDLKQDSRVFDVPAVKGRMAASSYAVKPGDALSAVFEPGQFAQQAYSLAVHGPNGFQRVAREIGRASCREGVELSGIDG